MVNQCICFFVEHNQKAWVKALLHICFNIMNTINASTGFLPFQLHIGRSPRLIPPILALPPSMDPDSEEERTRKFIAQLELDVMEAQDNLVAAKVDNCVMLLMKHCHHEYMQKSSGHVTKFMPRFDGPYTVIEVHPGTSTYTLDLPNWPNIFPTFHAS
ncbi:hypothetical protein HYDPIDRAFT_31840 [Hydnomerulius pinastri MD-312]|uniref:Tf2-1-like SH3-like domain-containing protein n=1 Tax=Hydnomerulius pinastri MD-312 TaxID=994086 RepID=A0A0C9WB82_9AGAM|nr:hypothetical protein HYDPIDRAFT_31840 [Hydnomerulius pinastri MD-312]